MNKAIYAAIAALVCGSAQADNDDHGVIFGIGAGRIDAVVEELGFDAEAAAYKAFVGYRFNRYLAIEGAYVDTQEATQEYGDNVKASLEATMMQAALVGTWWFNDYVNVYGRAGANWYDADAMVTDGFTRLTATDSGTEFGWGLGLGAVWDRALFRLEYEKVEFELVDSDQVSLSIAWRL